MLRLLSMRRSLRSSHVFEFWCARPSLRRRDYCGPHARAPSCLLLVVCCTELQLGPKMSRSFPSFLPFPLTQPPRQERQQPARPQTSGPMPPRLLPRVSSSLHPFARSLLLSRLDCSLPYRASQPASEASIKQTTAAEVMPYLLSCVWA